MALKFLARHLSQEGNRLVVRDEFNQPVRGKDGSLMAVPLPKQNASADTWRRALARLTNNGQDLQEVLYNLAMGNAYAVKLPDGRESDPIIPSAEVRRASATTLHEWLHGKAVAQTEVLKAEKDSEDVQQYRALSDEQLREAALPYLERIKRKELSDGGTTESSAEEGYG